MNKSFWKIRHRQETPRNPDGLTFTEFLEKNKDIRHIAEVCWYFGIQPDELQKELKTLLERE